MNRLVSAEARGREGLKGWTGKVEFGGCDVFGAPSGSGKSIILLMVSAGLRGLASTDTDTERDFIGPRPDVTVQLNWSETTPLSRRLKDGPRQKKSWDAANERAAAIVGEHTVRWDLSDFTRSGDSARKKLFDQVLQVAGATDEWTTDRVLSGLCTRLDLSKSDVLVDMENVFVAKNPPPMNALRELVELQPLEGADVGTWLLEATGIVPSSGSKDSWQKKANDTRKEVEAAVKRVQGAMGETPPTGTLDAARSKVATLETDLTDVEKKLATITQAASAQESSQATTDQLVTAVGVAQAETDEAERELKTITQGHTAIKAQMPGRAATVETTKTELDAQAEALTKKEATVQAAHSKKTAAATALGKAEGQTAALDSLIDGEGDSTCLNCGAADPLGLESRLKFAHVRLDEATADMTRATSYLSTMERMRDKTKERHAAANKTHNDALEAVRTLEARTNAAERSQSNATRRQENASVALVTAEQNLQGHQQREAERSSAATGFTGDHETLQATRDALVAQLGDSKDPGEDTAHWIVAQHITHLERERNLQQLTVDREAAVARFEQVKALGRALKELQSEVARAAYVPVCAAAQELLDECGAGLRVEIRGEGDFGAYVDPAVWPARHLTKEKYVIWWSLSGAQRALVGVALAVAFARLSGSPWPAVVLDDFQIIGASHRVRTLAGLSKMVQEDRLANVLIGWEMEELREMGEGVTLHWLGAESAESAKSAA